ncbi:MAG TPA: hypothetical protein VKS44_11720 [Candidatus Acidoferrales bacterium]|nr:hypothetical protein [Candidatus Acidoferrales bacterium]
MKLVKRWLLAAGLMIAAAVLSVWSVLERGNQPLRRAEAPDNITAWVAIAGIVAVCFVLASWPEK